MDPENPNPPAPENAPAPVDTSEADKLKAQLAALAEQVLSAVPEHLKPLIPAGLEPAARVEWFNNAKATGVFNSKPVIPETDSSKPTVTPKTADVSTLPPVARMARGYK
jgi:hypothetical protein